MFGANRAHLQQSLFSSADYDLESAQRRRHIARLRCGEEPNPQAAVEGQVAGAGLVPGAHGDAGARGDV